MKRTMKRLGCLLLSLAMALTLLPAAALAAEDEGRHYDYNGTPAVKVSNPTTQPGEDDGIVNGTDRLNSYAWAMAQRGDYLYIGGNRAYISWEAYRSMSRMAAGFGIDASSKEDMDKLYSIFNLFTYGQLPDYTKLSDKDFVPEIIRVDPKTGETKVLEMPEELKAIATQTEGCAFRSVVEQDGNLYFGSYGNNYVFLIRVDQNDRATVAYMAGKDSTGAHIQYNSLRACGVYHGVQYFGGSSSDLEIWKNDENKDSYVPLFIAEMKDERYDPNGGSRQDVAFSNYIADYRDFEAYADPKDPSVGNEFYDLVSYNDWLYAIISDSAGFAVYKGRPAQSGESANPYGWHWELVVDGADSASPANGFIAATPYLYQGELYIGTFSSIGGVAYTGAQMFKWVQGALKGDPGRSLSDVMAPLYNLMKKDAKVFRLENDQLQEVPDACEQLKGKCAVYLWRFLEYQDAMYMTTFDASILFQYVLDISVKDMLEAYLKSFQDTLDQVSALTEGETLDAGTQALLTAAEAMADRLETLAEKDSLSVEEIETLDQGLRTLRQAEAGREIVLYSEDGDGSGDADESQLAQLLAALKRITDSIDEKGIRMVVEMKRQLAANTSGFDLLKTADGDNWEFVLDDGFHDKFNYGGRTLAIFDDQLYVGTANPFYGAQLWKIGEKRGTSGGDSGTGGGSTGGDSGSTGGSTGGGSSGGSTGGGSTGTDIPDASVPGSAYNYSGVSACQRGKDCPISRFQDASASAWYHDGVHFCLQNGLMVGVTEETFQPDTATTRGMIAAMLYRLEGQPAVTGANPFPDVKSGSYCDDATAWAAANGIVTGYESGEFRPGQAITRQEMAAILYRYAQYQKLDTSVGEDTNILSFEDASQLSDYAIPAMQWAVGAGVINGTTASTLSPRGDASRAQVANILYRFLSGYQK